MANPAALRTGLATRLGSINGLKAYPRWPSQPPNLPCAIVRRGIAEPEQTLGRGDLTKWLFEVYVFTGLAAGYEQAQDNINPFLATSSTGGVFGAIDADRTLGGAAITTFVKAFREDDQYDFAEAMSYQGTVFDIEVWAS